MAAAETESAWKIIPQFPSRDIPTTIAFYTETLGFTLGGTHGDGGDGPTFCSVYAGAKAAANIYFFKTGEQEHVGTSAAMIALGTEQLDQLFERLRSAGTVEIVEEIEDKEWGYRQFKIKDPDGNTLTFFKFLEGGNPGTEE
jgi:uncharacterized glyoxalase superfamily protein PhnB